MRSALRLIVCIALAGCGQGAGGGGTATTTGDPCAGGLCSSGGGSSQAGSSSSGGNSSSSGGGCAETWSCTPWAKGGDGMFTRTCTDANKCGTTSSKPNEGPV